MSDESSDDFDMIDSDNEIKKPALVKKKSTTSVSSKKMDVDEEYVKMDQRLVEFMKWLTRLREHVLHRPDMYVGSIRRVPDSEQWLYIEGQGIVKREIDYFPGFRISFLSWQIEGLYKIFDEILVNAADNYQRDKSQKYIKVDIDATNNVISVTNDGRGIKW